MNPDATSLDRLHDLALPEAVPWWPLAPGWYVILVLLGLAVAWGLRRYWKQWRTDQYRREALRQLAQLQDAPAIAELLRRTALVAVPRSEIAAMTGSAWPEWLLSQCSEDMDQEVKKLLSFGVYAQPEREQDVELLRHYAARWISRHRKFSQ